MGKGGAGEDLHSDAEDPRDVCQPPNPCLQTPSSSR